MLRKNVLINYSHVYLRTGTKINTIFSRNKLYNYVIITSLKLEVKWQEKTRKKQSQTSLGYTQNSRSHDYDMFDNIFDMFDDMFIVPKFWKKKGFNKNKRKLRQLNDRKVFVSDDLTYKARDIWKKISDRVKELNVKVGYQYILTEGTIWIWSKK